MATTAAKASRRMVLLKLIQRHGPLPVAEIQARSGLPVEVVCSDISGLERCKKICKAGQRGGKYLYQAGATPATPGPDLRALYLGRIPDLAALNRVAASRLVREAHAGHGGQRDDMRRGGISSLEYCHG